MAIQIKNALQWGQHTLNASFSSSPRLDAEVLLSHVLKKPVTFLLTHDDKKLGVLKWFKFKRLIQQRLRGKPVAYLTGVREFFMLDFRVTPAVLIPRPDTEILVDEVLSYTRRQSVDFLVDVGTGSGCIPVSVCKNNTKLHAIAVDVSKKALKVARKNARRHRVGSRISFLESDLLEKVGGYKGIMVLTANLPYIPDEMQLNSETAFEPDLALRGGRDGLDYYRQLSGQIEQLKPQAIFLELFDFQLPVIASLFSRYRLDQEKPLTGKACLAVFERI